MTRVALYTRVSTDRQEAEGVYRSFCNLRKVS